MAGSSDIFVFKDALIILGTAAVVAPVVHRLKISPVLGFFAVGAALGPQGLGRLADDSRAIDWLTVTGENQIAFIADLGIVFLLFFIGLELSMRRLVTMRRLVFGLGGLQTLLTTVLISLGALWFGQPPAAALIIGACLALSSTALVMEVLSGQRRMMSTTGRTSFAILLAQDLAVVPLLFLIGALGNPAAETTSVAQGVVIALVEAVIAIAVIAVVGRLVLKPLFKLAAGTDNPEFFMAATLLIAVGSGVIAAYAGLSMALGAFVAGLLLAETEFRREVEISIEPFKGLLLGVFFVGVGISLDLDAVAADPVAVFGLAAMLTLLKAGLIFGAARLWGLNNRTAIETALVLGPAGEFAFVILGAGLVEGIAAPAFTRTVLMAATISIFTVPLMAVIADRLVRRVAPAVPELPPEALEVPSATSGQVLIVGYGRVGRLVGEMLAEHGQAFLAIDANPSTVAKGRTEGANVFYGDAGRTEMLERCGIDTARAVVVTMDAPVKVDEVVAATRSLRPDLILIARARDHKHAARLYALGVTDAVPETTEASLQLAENTLVDLGVPMGLVLASIHERRDRFRKLFQEAMPDSDAARSPRALRSTLRR